MAKLHAIGPKWRHADLYNSTFVCAGNIIQITLTTLDKSSENMAFIFFEDHPSFRCVGADNYPEMNAAYRENPGYLAYRVEGGVFLDNFFAEAEPIYKRDELQHFFILTSEDAYDVISYEEPLVLRPGSTD